MNTTEQILDPDNEYVLEREGDWVWITVGDFSLRVKHTANGGLLARAWCRGAEDGAALATIDLTVAH